MPLGVSKRDRMNSRTDKAWRSVWHRQMLSPNRTRSLDKRDGMLQVSDTLNVVGKSDNTTTEKTK